MAQDKGQKEKIMKLLGLTEAEAQEMLDYDKEVDRTNGGLEYDLTKEEQKMAIRDAHKGQEHKKKNTPTIYKFDQRKRKENLPKQEIISNLFNCLNEFTENAVITNKEREISFTLGDNTFTVTLTQKRKPKA